MWYLESDIESICNDITNKAKENAMHKHIDIANRYAGKACRLYTLDGIKEAVISNRLGQFATIKSLDGQYCASFNWPLVERKMESDKLFYIC